MLKQTYPYRLFLLWSLYIGVVSFLIWLSWEMDVLANIFIGDPTKITYLISFFFIGGTLHCGMRSCYLSDQINSIIEISAGSTQWTEENTLPAKFLLTFTESQQDQYSTSDRRNQSDSQLLTDIFNSEAHAQHELGWFVTSLLIKLGLLGTVVGFVLMLQPLSTLESFDVADIQLILVKMTSGMSVALNTTLLGLISSMLLSFQYLLLDRGADELVLRTVEYLETSVLPKLYKVISD